MARRLKTIAREINDTLPGYTASVTAERLDTDLKIGRIRYPRKGLLGNRLRVHDAKWREVFSHHTGDPYRNNEYVEEWLREEKEKLGISVAEE